jgi:hypothetical protein
MAKGLDVTLLLAVSIDESQINLVATRRLTLPMAEKLFLFPL